MDFETQHQLSSLDRHSVIKYFDETCLLERLEVPEHRRFFGVQSQSELLNAPSLLSLKGSRAKEIDVFVSGVDWEVSNHPFLNKLKYLSNQSVRLLVADTIMASINPEIAWQLQRIVDVNVSVETYKHPEQLSEGVYPVLRLVINDKEYWYATDDTETISLNSVWGMTEQESLVTNNGSPINFLTAPLDLSEKAASSSLSSNIGLITDVGSLNGDISRFGKSFVNLILEKNPALNEILEGGIERIIYQDRYLMSPITVMLVAEIFLQFNEQFGSFNAEIETSYPNPSTRSSTCVADNFANQNDWSDFVSGIMDSINLNIFSEFLEKRDLSHGRGLTIETKNYGSYRLLFDQGMGHWGYRSQYSRTRFNFSDCRTEGENYRRSGVTVREGSGDTYIVIHEVI